MVDDKPDDPSPDLERGRRAPPTLDLDAIEISDETSKPEPADAVEKPEHARSRPRLLATMASAAILAAIFGGSAAALVVWAMGWQGKAAPPAAVAQVDTARLDALAARLDKVESKAAPADKAALDALTARIADVESRPAAPAVSTPAAPAAPDPALSAQIGDLEKSVTTLRGALAANRGGDRGGQGEAG
jgi:hypothetical protein